MYDALLRLFVKDMHLGKIECKADSIARSRCCARTYARSNAELIHVEVQEYLGTEKLVNLYRRINYALRRFADKCAGARMEEK